jgi:PAS domain S-box-containing protein
MQLEQLLHSELSRHWCHGTNIAVVLRDRFDMLFEHSVDGVFFMTLDEPIVWHGAADQDALLEYAFEHCRITAANRAMCEMMGAPREQLIGSVPSSRWGQQAPLWKQKMRELYEHGRMYQSLRAPRSDGTWMYVEGQYVCTYDDHGRITGHFGTQHDVTEKRYTAELLELALESADIGIWEIDLTTNELRFDDRFIVRMGYSLADPRVRDGHFWSTTVHPSDMPEAMRALTAHLQGNAALYRIEHRVRDATGQWRWLLSSGRVTARDVDGRPIRMVGGALDITERKQLQERLFLAERMASIGTLAAGVGHEINNPLTYIVLNLTLIDRELRALDMPPTTRERIAHMIDQARFGTDRVSRIVRDLQALTRVPEERVAKVDLRGALTRCLEIADHQIRHRARVILELGDVPAVRGSEGRIVQLFLNLLVNAAQAIAVGSADTNWIKLAMSTNGDRVVVVISDSGVGIEPDALGRIFDPFYTTKQVGEGTGLGLAICRSIVAAMGGEIDVDSTPGQGTSFRVLLPVAGDGHVDIEASPPSPEPCDKKRVLVVDDEPMVGHLVAKVLSGHDVVAETSARAALTRLANDNGFDLILCDLMMPEVTGMDFYAQLAPDLRRRIVFLSGGAFTDRAQNFLDSVPNRRLAKPFDVDALTAVLISSGDHDALP